MNQIPWGLALAVFLGTLPLLGAVLWNLIDVKQIRTELVAIRAELVAIRVDIANIRERVAVLEERDRLTHALLKG